MGEPRMYVYEIESEKKHSRRYAALDAKAPLKTIYVSRTVADWNDYMVLIVIPFSAKPNEGELEEIKRRI